MSAELSSSSTKSSGSTNKWALVREEAAGAKEVQLPSGTVLWELATPPPATASFRQVIQHLKSGGTAHDGGYELDSAGSTHWSKLVSPASNGSSGGLVVRSCHANALQQR